MTNDTDGTDLADYSLYENDYYLVVPVEFEAGVVSMGNTYYSGYGVYNSDTGILEFKTPVLPDALYFAASNGRVLENRTWDWGSGDPLPGGVAPDGAPIH